MNIQIQEVVSKKDQKRFVLFPHTLYQSNAFWVPSIIRDEINLFNPVKNPAFRYCEAKCWLAFKDGQLVGRIAAVINHSFISKWKKPYARFGWLDFIDEYDVSAALFETAEAWARKKNLKAMHGPLGFTDFDPQGLLVEGFDELGILDTIYNHSYYAAHLERLGYQKDVDWVQLKIKIPPGLPARIESVAEAAISRSGIYVLKVKQAKELRPYAKGVFDLINESYKDLYGVVTLSEEQIETYTNQYFSFIHPDYISIVLRKNEVVGFAIGMPSLSKALQKCRGRLFPFGIIRIYRAFHKNDSADLYMMAVKPGLQGKGVSALLTADMHEKFIRNHISTACTHPMLEMNIKMLSVWNSFEKCIHKRRRCYIRQF